MRNRSSEQPRDGLTAALWIVLIGLLLTGALAVSLAAVNSHEEAERNEEEISLEVTRDLEATVSELRASLSGAQAMVDNDGTVQIPRFERLAKDVLVGSAMAALALEVPVSGDERADFEDRTGRQILEPGPEGLVVAETRPAYLPVRWVVPLTPETDKLIGFDLSADPVRRDATNLARDTGEFVISAPVRSAGGAGDWSSFVVQALYRPGAPTATVDERRAAVVGYLTSAVPGSRIIDRTKPLLPAGVHFSIVDGDVTLGSTTAAPLRDHTATAPIGGRTWQLAIDDGRDPSYGFAWLIAVATILLAFTTGFVLWQRITVQRARSAEAERHARNAELAQRLAEARTTASVAAAIQDEVPPLLGATNASLRVVDQTNGVLRPLLDERVDQQLADAFEAIPVDDTTPAGRAVLTRSWLLIEDMSRERETYGDELVSLLRRHGMASMALVPLLDDEGAVVALLGAVWDRPRTFDPNTKSLLRTIAEISEQTLERSRLHDSEHQLVTELQNSALQMPPAVDGLDIAVRYRAAEQTLTMGGDWYDAIPLDDERLALVVGDVAGHGVAAVAEMIELRSVISALLRSGQSLEDILAAADDVLLASRDTRMATVAIAVIDARRERLLYASAGHPPSMLRLPDGSVEVLMDGRRSVLGLRPASRWSPAERPFPPGVALVSYTDGLIERRDEDLGTSLDRLTERMRGTDSSAEGLADDLLVAFLDVAPVADDVALVVITTPLVPAAAV